MADNLGHMPGCSVRLGVFQRSANPSEPCGDGYLFEENGDNILVALVDGLGHGRAAESAAQEALASFRALSSLPLQDIVWKTHARIRDTRGCVAFIGRINLTSHAMECISIGNIICRIRAHGQKNCIPYPGVIGHKITKVILNTILLEPGDMIVLCSDGISARLDIKDLETVRPRDQAEEIFMRYRHGHDDTTVLVIHIQPDEHEQETVSRGMVSDRV